MVTPRRGSGSPPRPSSPARIEALQLRRGGTLSDGLADFAFVLAGALWTAAGGGLPLWLAVAGGLAIGTVRRARDAASVDAAPLED